MISENRPFSSALVVTYIFSLKLERFESFIHALKITPSLNEREQLKRLFIGK